MASFFATSTMGLASKFQLGLRKSKPASVFTPERYSASFSSKSGASVLLRKT